jgi:hypothetical protein
MHKLLFGPFGKGEKPSMKLYKKEGNILQILSFPNETVEKGDYLLIEDAEAWKSPNRPSNRRAVRKHTRHLRRVAAKPSRRRRTNPRRRHRPLEIAPHITYIQDASLLNLQNPRNRRRRKPKPKQFMASITLPINNQKTAQYQHF